MSGIAGIFYRNNKPVYMEQLQAMGAALAHRGPDGINYYCKDSVGLVHCMLYDTPESLFETLPNRADNDTFVLTFHGRIDNRQELYDKIGLTKPLSAITDSDLILAAYRKWKKECVNHFLGDFAFTVWDQIERKMFCARDHMGVAPLYYHLTEKLFAFSSEVNGLLTLKEIPRCLNEERIADFLTNVVTEKESTFYSKIFHLPPAHYLEINSERSTLNRYHDFVPQKPLCKNRSEFEEQFREIFMNAVQCRLRSAFPLGSYLSGGLDSSSIVCTVAGAMQSELSGGIETFSGIFETVKKCDERHFFESVLERYGLRHHFVYADLLHPGAAFDELISVADEPPFSPHFFMKWNLTCLARKAGMRIMLDGHDGDSAISYGIGLFRELALQGNVRGLIDEYRAFDSSSSILVLMKKILRAYYNLGREKIPIISFYNEEKKRLMKSLSILDQNFVSKINIVERLSFLLQQQPIQGLSEQEHHRRNISHPLQPYMLGFLERLGSHFSTILRFPYFDKRIIDFCVGLPSNEKFCQGYNRSIVRRSLAEYLPKVISERKTKTDFSSNLINAFSVTDREWISNSLDTLSSSTYSYINIKFLEDCISNFFNINSKLRQVDLYPVIRVISLNKWLEKNAKF